MKPCVGCRYLVRLRGTGAEVCRARDGQDAERVENPYTGHTAVYYGFRPTVQEMRAEGALCGPGRALYRPNMRTRLWDALTGKG